MSEGKILVVDDNIDHTLMLTTMLQVNGIDNEVIIAENGSEALDYLFLNKDNMVKTNNLPSLILLDIDMPKIDGIQVLVTIRDIEVTKNIPVVIITSSVLPEHREKAERYGVNGFLIKPFDIDEFVALVRKYLKA